MTNNNDLKFDFVVFFFFQAEDGIRDFHVTGVQTCALPISQFFLFATRHGSRFIDRSRSRSLSAAAENRSPRRRRLASHEPRLLEYPRALQTRSEERRVGKECRSRWSPYNCKKKMI